MKLPIY